MHFSEYVVGWSAGGTEMRDLLLIGGIVAGWFVLQRYILPRLGVPT